MAVAARLRLGALAAVLITLASVQHATAYSKRVAVVVFGDSLSDNGNFFRATNGTAPNPKAYYKGRFTSAPGVWADQLPRYVKSPASVITPNFAFGGATACSYDFLPAELRALPSADTLVRQYLAALKAPNSSLAKQMRGYTAVPWLWLGANDVQFLSSVPPERLLPIAFALPGNISSCLSSAASLLIQNGHKQIVLSTMAPFELTPLIIRTNSSAQATQLVAAINGAITLAAARLQALYPNATVTLVNMHEEISESIRNFKAGGFKFNTPDRCFQNISVTYSGASGLLPGAICKRPDDYVFLDNLHPSGAGHRVIVWAALKVLVNKLKLFAWRDTRPVRLSR